MIENACCFTGHRMIRKTEREEIQKNLRKTILELIGKGVNTFLCGGALGFDTMAALEVLELKKEKPEIRLVLALPCVDQEKNWRQKEKETYWSILKLADEIIYVSKKYTDECMRDRNRYMVDHSAYCVCYLRRERSGTAVTVKYAKEKGRTVMEL